MVVKLFLAGVWNSKESCLWQKLYSSGKLIPSLLVLVKTSLGLMIGIRHSRRMLQVERGLWRPCRSSLYSEQDQINLLAQGFSQYIFKCFQGWRFRNLSGPLFQYWTAFMITKLFLIPFWNSLSSDLNPFPFALPLCIFSRRQGHAADVHARFCPPGLFHAELLFISNCSGSNAYSFNFSQ